ncbi:MAG: DUF2218 domain-containing protein [Nocardioides sp.]
MATRHGSMATERPERYAKQLAGHWSAKTTVEDADDRTVLRFPNGNVVELRSVEGALDVTVSVPDRGDPDRFAQVVAEHLQRFGHRDKLTVVWS